MKFGKLSKVDDVDFELPDLQFISTDPKPSTETKIFLGTTGWSNKEWNGSYYPKGTKSSTFLTEYAKLFNTIELNSTHYHIPSEERVSEWKSKVHESFLFCPKVPQNISHRSNLSSETSQTISFFRSMQGLNSSLGPIFMQLPEYFAPQGADQLLHFLSRKPKGIRFAIELRHQNWFKNDAQQLKLLAQQLESSNTALVITDVAGRRDVCHSLLSNQTLMIRLVGNSMHTSDYQRMDHWLRQIKKHYAKFQDIYIFFHQPTMDIIPQMVNYFISGLEKIGKKSPISPLKEKFKPDVQLSLF